MSTCLVPFNQLYVHSSGEVYPCSFVQNNPEFVLGDIKSQSLKEIWHSGPVRKLRESHLGQLPVSCEQNQDSFLCHKISLRNNFNKPQLKLKRLDLMLDSACNLTCIMCTNIYDKTGGFRHEFFWQHNDETLREIEELELVGGEPLISPYFPRLVELMTRINPQCEWRMTTNAHFPLTPGLLSNLRRINLQTLSISLDSLKAEVFEKIRQRSQFQLVFNNIIELKKLIPQIQINMVVQQLNRDEVVGMYEWCRDQDLQFYPILLLYPKDHSLLTLSKEENKSWLLQLMERNLQVQSREIFFLIKKTMRNLDLQKDPDVLTSYLDQLKLMERIGGQ